MYTVQFYSDRKGQEPVKDFLGSLTKKEKTKIPSFVFKLKPLG